MTREDVTIEWRKILALGDLVMYNNRLCEIIETNCKLDADGWPMYVVTPTAGYYSGDRYLASKMELFLPTFTARPEGEF